MTHTTTQDTPELIEYVSYNSPYVYNFRLPDDEAYRVNRKTHAFGLIELKIEDKGKLL